MQYSLSGQFDDAVIVNLPANSTGSTTDAFGDGTRVWFRSRAYGNGQDTAYTPKRYGIEFFEEPLLFYPNNQVTGNWFDGDLVASDTQHDTVPFLVRGGIGGQFANDLNWMLEIQRPVMDALARHGDVSGRGSDSGLFRSPAT